MTTTPQFIIEYTIKVDPLLPLATRMEKVSGDNQTSAVGDVWIQPFIVKIYDQFDKPMNGVKVDFTVLEGGGYFNRHADGKIITNVTRVSGSNRDGWAWTYLRLGKDPGINRVQVKAERITETITFSAKTIEPPPPEPETVEPPPDTAIAESTPPMLHDFDLVLTAGYNLIHLPIKVKAVDGEPRTVESIRDFYRVLNGMDTVLSLIVPRPAMPTWNVYLVEEDFEIYGDLTITEQTGIIVNMKAPLSVRLSGDVFEERPITLNQGLNLVGLPHSRIIRVSDLFTLAQISIVVVWDKGRFKLAGRAGDPGDIEIMDGQSFIIVALRDLTIP